MRTAVYAALAVTLFAVTSAPVIAATQKTTRGSFLRYRANSARELATTVKRDPSVASRYAKHFGTTNYGIDRYFSDRLTLIRLRKATTTYVYYYNSQGRVTRGRRVMPAGTLVFATDAGEPVLDWRCGNPLRASLPVRQAIKPDKTFKAKAVAGTLKPVKSGKAGAAVVAAGPPDADKVIEKVLGAPPTELPVVAAAIAPPTSTVAAAAPIVPVATAPTLPAAGVAVPPIVEVATAPAVTAISAAPALAAASKGFSWLLPLAAAGGVAVAKSKETSETPEDEQPVPEPGALIPLMAGIGTVCAAIRRSRKRH